MMAKMIKKTMAMVLALCISFSALPLQALADEISTDEKTVDGVKIITTTTTTDAQKDPATGDTTVTVTIQKDSEGTKTSTGEKVIEASETTVTTTVTDTDGKKTITKEVDGHETIEEERAPEVTVKLPTTTDDLDTEENEGQATATTPAEEPKVEDHLPENAGENDYDYTTETVKKPGSVTVTTKEVEVTDQGDVKGTDMNSVTSDVAPDAENDLIKENASAAPDAYQPGSEVENPELPKGQEGYDYTFVGTGNTSQFRPAVVFTDPMSPKEKVENYGNEAYIHISNGYANTYIGWLNADAKSKVAKKEDGTYVTDEQGFILDIDGNRVLKEEKVMTGPNGETYYLHRFDALGAKLDVEGWREDGGWVKDLNGKNKYRVVWSAAQMFVLVDKETGDVVNAYSADLETKTKGGFGYNVENLEDADHYSEEDAKRIRAIVQSGYMGVTGTETNEKNVTSPKAGSLEAMKEKLLASGKFDEKDLEFLTDGVAMSATQMAIWACTHNEDGIEFVNAHYFGKPEETETDVYGQNGNGNIPADKVDETNLMFRIYEYLINLEGVEKEGTTKDTIINEENFIKDMEITVVEKVEEKNKSTNNAYVTNLTFALVVEVDEDNGDNLKVSVVDSNGKPILNAKGKPVVGRIAGELQDGEVQLDTDDDGNYCFQNIVLTEGDNTFKLNLEGIQNLEKGVYLYSSEVRDEVSSQSMIGVTGGKHGVNVSMDLKFELNVEDKVVVKEHVWHSEKVTVKNPTEENENAPANANNIPQEGPQVYNMNRDAVTEIIDEQVPLAAAPKTGDASFLFIALALFAAISLCAANFDKKRKHETF